MSKSNTTPEPVYELKHRIVGAVSLVAIAVIVIPLLLPEPLVEANNAPGTENAKNEQGFKSRIVPLDLNNVNGNKKTSTGVSGNEASKPVLLDVETGAAKEPSNTTGNSAQVSTSIVMTQQPAPKPALITGKKVTPVKSDTDSKPTEKKVAAVKLPKETGHNGWVVRVGTYSKKANVESMSTLLTNSGFKPRTTPVTTSLGKFTRVWLGPFAQKETADKIGERLKSLTGEKGYVTRNNS